MKKKSWIVSVASVCVVAGCTQTTKYHWGEYEEQVYRMYAAPDQATAVVQIEALEADLEKAASLDKPLPPGLRAHLGYLYYQLGRYDEAKAAFSAEKTAFPESSDLMDRFISRTGK